MHTIYKHLGNKIRHYRKERNLSTQELAKRLDISVGLLNNIENGRNDVFKLELISKIISTFNISATELLEFIPKNSDNICLIQKRHVNIEVTMDKNNIEQFEKLKDSVAYILDIYLELLSEYDYDERVIDYINKHISEELQFIKNFGSKVMLG